MSAADLAQKVIVQADGKIVLAGSSNNGTNNDFALVRYKSDGTLDITFGTYGKVVTPVGAASSGANSIAIQSDNKIVLAGSSNNGADDDFALVRYNSDGSLDSTFGTGGKVTTDFGSSVEAGNSIAIQSNGKMIVAGYTNSGITSVIALARYNSDGTLDNAFGVGGKVTSAAGTVNDGAQSIAIQTDGKIVVAGFSTIGFNPNFALLRYNNNGSLDSTFGTGGIVTTAIGNTDDEGYSVAVQNNGKIVVTGISSNGSDYDFAVVRYNSDGNLDNTFGSGGKVTTAVGSNDDVGQSVAIQGDNKIVVAGYSYNGADNDFALVRYNTNGSLDTAFSNNSKIILDLKGADDAASSVVIGGDGKIVVAGTGNNGYKNDFVLVQYNGNGSLDNTFGLFGRETTPIASGATGSSLTIQSDGKILVGGRSFNGSDNDFALVRYKVDGNLDNTFGYTGIVTTAIGNDADYGNSVAIQTDGKIVVAGYSNILSNNIFADDFALIRLNNNGLLDNTFGIGGKVTSAIGSVGAVGKSVAIQTDGKIVVAGISFNSPTGDFALIRYNTNGTLDNTFGTGGKVVTPIGNANSGANSIAIQSDDKIVVAGFNFTGNNYDFAAIRYNSNGTPDSAFGLGGIVTTAIGNADDIGDCIAIQSDGKILVAGFSMDNSAFKFALIRYNTNGTLDNTFGSEGKVTTAIAGVGDNGESIAIQNDGKILVAGISSNGTDQDFGIIRYLSDGTLDNTFSSDGKVATDFQSSSDAGISVAIQGDGKIVVAGYSDNSIALARYNGDCTPVNFSQSVTLSGSQTITEGTHIYTSGDTSGIYIDTLTAGNSCDSIVSTHLTVITAINNFSADARFKVYPNPFTSELIITGTKENTNLIIFDPAGKEIIRQKTVDTESKINTALLKPGLYFLNYTVENRSKNIKIVKL